MEARLVVRDYQMLLRGGWARLEAGPEGGLDGFCPGLLRGGMHGSGGRAARWMVEG